MNLIELRSHALDEIEAAYATKKPFVSIKTEIIDLFQHLKYLQSGPVCFIKEKDSDLQFLAHGAYQIFDGLESTKFSAHEYIFGAEKFPNQFGEFNNGYFFRPIILYKKDEPGHKTEVKIFLDYEAIPNKKTLSKFIIYISELLTFTNELSGTMPKRSQIVEVPEIDDWKSKVTKVTSSITDKQKIVLSRQKIISYKSAVSESSLIDNIPMKDGQYLFYLKPSSGNFFISISPEKLFSLRGNQVSVDCIAGTRPRGNTKNEDSILEKELINSEKERAEHLFVANFLEEKMNKFCSNLTMTKAFDILKLSKVQHLNSEFVGELKNGKSYLDIVKEIYPTPAVAGTPSKYAITNIKEIEKVGRDFYAGACGYIAHQKAELLVGIRSIQVKGDKVYVYGGAGIVNGSDYQKEWLETEQKMKNFSFLWEE